MRINKMITEGKARWSFIVFFQLILLVDDSLHILIFNNSQIQYFPKILDISLPKFFTLKTSEKSSKNSQIIIDLRTVT